MTSTPQGNRAVIYVRESKDQWKDARAVERFEQACRRLCDRRGLAVVRVLIDNDVAASGGNKGTGYAEVLRMMRAGETDYVVVPVVDRMVRTLRDLEDVIEAAEQGKVTVLATSGDLDLSHDQGRLVARILASVAKGETERKGKRQKDANAQAAAKGQPRKGTPRPFGWEPDRVTERPEEADAIRWAADIILGGGSISGIAREWDARGLRPPQSPYGPLPPDAWKRNTVRTILLNPRLAGLSTYYGEIVGEGQWAAILPEDQWRAVAAILADESRARPRGNYTLLGGLARCRCGTTVIACPDYRGNQVYRCNPQLRRGLAGPHCQQRAAYVNATVEAVVLDRLGREDLSDLIASLDPGAAAVADTAALSREAASIRENLAEMAEDRALGVITRAQMITGTERGEKRLAEIAAQLEAAAGGSVLAPFAAGKGEGKTARETWEGLDLARKRAVVDVLTPVTILPAGRGARAFRPETILTPGRGQ